MIADVIEGREKSRIVIIEDSVLQSGRPLLIAAINKLCQRVEKVHIFCFEKTPDLCKAACSQDIVSRLVLHDGVDDVCGWNNPNNLNVHTDFVMYLNNKHDKSAHLSVSIVIDSLSPMLLDMSPSSTCQVLSRLSSAKIQGANVEQVICLLHGDLHDNHSLALVHHTATTIIKVMPPKLNHFFMSCHMLHKRLSGKVLQMTEHFNLDKQYCITDVTEFKANDTGDSSITAIQPDPTANLTFNLSLSDKEKQARSEVKLPYTFHMQMPDEAQGKCVGEGKIFYQPDEADDFDEEDPDEDLDI